MDTRSKRGAFAPALKELQNTNTFNENAHTSTPKFILIDHSLIGSGGHYMEYDRRVLIAAADLGFQCALLTSKKAVREDLAKYINGRLLPAFSDGFFNINRHFFSVNVTRSPEPRGALSRLGEFPPVSPGPGRRKYHTVRFVRRELLKAKWVARPSAVYFDTPFWSPPLTRILGDAIDVFGWGSES